MDWGRIREKWAAAFYHIVGDEGEDNPTYLLEVATEIPLEVKQQFTDLIVNGNNINYGIGKALHRAVESGRFECVKCLVEELHADVNVRAYDGRTALHWAARRDRRLNVARYLVETCGADVNAVEMYGWTPLHLGAFRDAEIFVSYLSLYCDTNIKSKLEACRVPSGSTALQVAEIRGRQNGLKCLKFVTATSAEDLVGPPTSNMAKYYLIMRYLKVGDYAVNKLSLPLDVLSSASYLPICDEDVSEELRERNDTEMLMGFTTLVDISMASEHRDDLHSEDPTLDRWSRNLPKVQLYRK